MDKNLSHIDSSGKAKMVDVGMKKEIYRMAIASGFIHLSTDTIKLIKENNIKKGDVLTVSRIAGIMASKQTDKLIPLCHNINIDSVEVECSIIEEKEKTGIEIITKAKCFGRTGIEMEVLTAVSITALTIWDMCKAVDKNMKITNITLLDKIKSENII